MYIQVDGRKNKEENKMKKKISKEWEGNYKCRGIVLGSTLLNCCGHIDMKVLAIDFKSQTILINGYSGLDLPTIAQIKKSDDTHYIVYVKEAKREEYNLWISLDEIEKYNRENKEEEEVAEEKTYDTYRIAFIDFKKRVLAGDIDDGEEFELCIPESSDIMTDFSSYGNPEKYNAYIIDSYRTNLRSVLLSFLHYSELLAAIFYIIEESNELEDSLSYKIIHNLYLKEKIHSFSLLEDGRIVLLLLKEGK